MRCKPDQMVILLRASADYAKPYVGEVRKTVVISHWLHDYWYLSPPPMNDGKEIIWKDCDLYPINPGETPAESIEAMRLLTQVKEKV